MATSVRHSLISSASICKSVMVMACVTKRRLESASAKRDGSVLTAQRRLLMFVTSAIRAFKTLSGCTLGRQLVAISSRLQLLRLTNSTSTSAKASPSCLTPQTSTSCLNRSSRSFSTTNLSTLLMVSSLQSDSTMSPTRRLT